MTKADDYRQQIMRQALLACRTIAAQLPQTKEVEVLLRDLTRATNSLDNIEFNERTMQGVTEPARYGPMVGDYEIGLSFATFRWALQAWARETFPNQTAESIIAHLREEAEELILAVDTGGNVPEELADIFSLALVLDVHLPGYNLLGQAWRKLEINRTRTFSDDRGGYVGHERSSDEASAGGGEGPSGEAVTDAGAENEGSGI